MSEIVENERSERVRLWVGTSGYSYKAWLGSFYPERLPARQMLAYYASRLPAVEINNTFYRLPSESTLASWAAQVGGDFRFALKASQRITHVKRLKDSQSEVDYLFRVAAVMGPALGAILFQLPPNLRKDIGRLETFLGGLPPTPPAAFEFRHPSWFEEDVFRALNARDCALCLTETDDSDVPELPPTASWGYVRLRRARYGREDLSRWKSRIVSQGWEQAYIFFKHEDEGIGPRLATEFLNLP